MRKDAENFAFKLGEGDFQRSYSYPLPQVYSLAKSLGMDLSKDREFIWFLKQALVAVLPTGPAPSPLHLSSVSHPLICPYRAAYAKLLEMAVQRKSVPVVREERRMSMRQRRLEPIDVVTLQTREEQEATLSQVSLAYRSKLEAISASEKLEKAVLETQSFYEVLLPAEETLEEYRQTWDYQHVDPREVLGMAVTLGVSKDPQLFSLVRVFSILPLPPLWKLTFDAFQKPSYTHIYYNTSTSSHPVKPFFQSFRTRLAPLTKPSRANSMTFLDELGRDYDVDLNCLIGGVEYVIRVGEVPKTQEQERTSHRKASVGEVLNEGMQVEIAEQCGLQFSTDIHLLSLVFAHFSAPSTLAHLSSWEFRFSSASEKYWFQPASQRASKSYPYRLQLKQLLASMKLLYFRRFGPMVRERNELPAVFADKSNQFMVQIRSEAANLMLKFLSDKLENREIGPYSLSNPAISLLFSSISRKDIDPVLFYCPFRLLHAEIQREDMDSDYVSEEESLGIVEAEDIKDMIDDIKRDFQRNETLNPAGKKKGLWNAAKTQLLGVRKGQSMRSPRPGSRTGTSFAAEAEILLKPERLSAANPTRTSKKSSTLTLSVLRQSEAESPSKPQTARIPTNSLSQSSIPSLSNVPILDETGEMPKIEETKTAKLPAKMETGVLNDQQISVLKSLRAKLKLPSIEIVKKSTEARKDTVKSPLKTGVAQKRRKNSRQMTMRLKQNEPPSAREPISALNYRDQPSPELPPHPTEENPGLPDSPIPRQTVPLQLYPVQSPASPFPRTAQQAHTIEEDQQSGSPDASPTLHQPTTPDTVPKLTVIMPDLPDIPTEQVVKEEKKARPKPKIPGFTLHLAGISSFLPSGPSSASNPPSGTTEREEEVSPLVPTRPPPLPVPRQFPAPKPLFIHKSSTESTAIRATLQALVRNTLRSKEKSPRKRDLRILEQLEGERKQKIARERLELEEEIRPWSKGTARGFETFPSPVFPTERTAPSRDFQPTPLTQRTTDRPLHVEKTEKQAFSPISEVLQASIVPLTYTQALPTPSESTVLPTVPLTPPKAATSRVQSSAQSTHRPLKPTESFSALGGGTSLRITKRASTSLSCRTASTDWSGWTPVSDREEMGLTHYVNSLGSPLNSLEVGQFQPVARLLPVHVVQMGTRIGIQASIHPYESMESDLLHIAFIQLVAPSPPSFPLLDFPSVTALPVGAHPGDLYFQMALAQCRQQRERELRQLVKGERAANVVERSWLPFRRDSEEVYRRNFMTGEEVGSKTLFKGQFSGKRMERGKSWGERAGELGGVRGLKLAHSCRHLQRSSL